VVAAPGDRQHHHHNGEAGDQQRRKRDKVLIVNSIALLPGRSELSEGGAEPLLHAMHRGGRSVEERLRVHAE
jgi:hypothetical protein